MLYIFQPGDCISWSISSALLFVLSKSNDSSISINWIFFSDLKVSLNDSDGATKSFSLEFLKKNKVPKKYLLVIF